MLVYIITPAKVTAMHTNKSKAKAPNSIICHLTKFRSGLFCQNKASECTPCFQQIISLVWLSICIVNLLSGTCHKSPKLSCLMNDGILAPVGVLAQKGREGGSKCQIGNFNLFLLGTYCAITDHDLTLVRT